jgi:hypothetical protein
MKYREVNYNNVRYGMLVEVLNDNGSDGGLGIGGYNSRSKFDFRPDS